MPEVVHSRVASQVLGQVHHGHDHQSKHLTLSLADSLQNERAATQPRLQDVGGPRGRRRDREPWYWKWFWEWYWEWEWEWEWEWTRAG